MEKVKVLKVFHLLKVDFVYGDIFSGACVLSSSLSFKDIIDKKKWYIDNLGFEKKFLQIKYSFLSIPN